MKFSAQEEYGIRCLLQLGRLEDGDTLTIPQITHKEGLTEPNVAKLLSILRREGFVTSARGQLGGYKLARPADEIVIGEVMTALGGRLFGGEYCMRHSGSEDACVHMTECSLKSFWSTIQSAVDTVIYRVTLADLLKSQEKPTVLVQLSDAPPRRGEIANVG